MTFVERLDRYQRNHRRAGVPIAVIYKFVDDQGTYLAAIITYYGIVSLFPLLLLLSTILNFVLQGDPSLQQDVLNSALGQFPVVGDQLADPRGISGSGARALPSASSARSTAGSASRRRVQNAMNTIWRVPRNSRPNPLQSRAAQPGAAARRRPVGARHDGAVRARQQRRRVRREHRRRYQDRADRCGDRS